MSQVLSRRRALAAPAIALMVLLCAIWAVQQVAIKLAAQQGIPPVLQAGARSAGAAILLLGWVALRRGRAGLRGLVSANGSWRLGGLLAAIFVVEFLLLFPALQLTTASRAVLFLYTAPFFVAIGAHLAVPAERLRARQVLGLACAFAGVALALGDGLRAGGGSLLGDGLITGAALMWAAATVLVKASPTLRATTPDRILLYQLAGSAPPLLAVAWALGDFGGLGQASGAAWLWLAYSTAIVAFASYLAWFWMISRYPAGSVSAFTFLTPLFGMIAGATLLGEAASPVLLLALAGVAAGLWLING